MLAALALCFLAAADGVQLFEQRQFPAAETEFRRILTAHPRDARTRLNLARTLVEMDRVPEALMEIDRTLAGPADAETQFQAGRILRDLAERRFAALQRLAPDSAASHELAGRHFEQRGQLPEALREYRAAIAKEPGRPGVHFEAGNILWRMRELEQATQELKSELSRTPHHGMANLRLGQVYLAGNGAGEALPFLEQAAGAMPESMEARRELGKAYRALGRTAAAKAQWEAVAKARPEDDQVHYLLGNLYRQLGDAEGARRELERHRQILDQRQSHQ
jgi:predicted Zn-dependent protease